jgi:hypothetical protein
MSTPLRIRFFIGIATLALPAMPSVAIAAKPVTCAIPSPCAVYSNTSSGAGLQGTSSTGVGLSGVSAAGEFYDPGIDGESSTNNGDDTGGGFGLNFLSGAVAPEYGVVAFGLDYGVSGAETDTGKTLSTSGYGVQGEDTAGTANGAGDYNVGVAGSSTVGTGVLGTSHASPVVSIFGEAPVGVYGVAATQSGTPNGNAFAFFGETNSFGLDIHSTASNSNSVIYALSPGFLFFGQSGSGGGQFWVDNSGNERLSGTLTTSKGGPYVETTGASGTAMTEYGERTTVPQVEDVGEGQLQNGRGYVNIDARLADTIDRRVAYHVFVTPEGDCNGLYVTQKGPAGFAVRELRGGHGSLAFEYRIVAKPIDENGQRLAIAPRVKAEAVSDGMKPGRLQGLGPMVTPQDRLKRRIGTQAYAETMLDLRARAARH